MPRFPTESAKQGLGTGTYNFTTTAPQTHKLVMAKASSYSEESCLSPTLSLKLSVWLHWANLAVPFDLSWKFLI